MKLRVLVAAGGTGGHFYPGLAVLDALRERADVEPVFVGTSRGIEARVVPSMGAPLELMDVAPLKGIALAGKLRALARLPRAAWVSRRVIARHAPDVVLSVGGYAAGPIAAMAIAARVPVAAIVMDAMPGFTHRVVGRGVARAYLTYDEASRWFARGAVRLTGTPVRGAFVERAKDGVERAPGARPHVLVIGGSQGARALNRAMPGAVDKARRAGLDFTVEHQTGVAERDEVAGAYAQRGLEGVEATAFIDDVASAMARADLLVCRAGAGTVAELGVIGRPAVFVPLPTAADDHQRKNAEAIAARGAGVCLLQSALDDDALAAQLIALLGDRPRLATMAACALSVGRPDAAERIADDIVELVARRR